MADQVHGHEVLDMLLASPQAYTRASLLAAVVQRFGEHARYFTCSARDMTAEQLLDFLAVRDKFVEHSAGTLEADPSRMCNHDRDHDRGD